MQMLATRAGGELSNVGPVLVRVLAEPFGVVVLVGLGCGGGVAGDDRSRNIL